MHLPPHFTLDEQLAVDLAEERGFGTLVVAGPEALEASALPFLVVRDAAGTRVQAHVASGNPLVALVQRAPAALMVVELADGYVSPSWYPSKAEHHRVVPTWNYVAVHLHGTVRPVTDAPWLRDLVRRSTDRHERAMPSPWSVDDAPAGYIDSTLRGIVGIELHVVRIEGKAKLSQNRPAADAAAVERAHRAGGRPALADLMARVARDARTEQR